jgi:hypothetical protein
MSVEVRHGAPVDLRRVPLLEEPALDHYPEFARFLAATFGLDADPFGPPAVVAVDDRLYELVFVGRSGRSFPCGVEVLALVEGLEPLDVARADRDLLRLLAWLFDGVGPPWSAEGLERTARIFRVADPAD